MEEYEEKSQLERDIEIISEICRRYGWQLMIPTTEDDDEVPGLVLGTEEFINSLVDEDDDKPEILQ